MARTNATAAWAARRALSQSSPPPGLFPKSSRSCAKPAPPNVPAAHRIKKAKTPLKNSDAMDTCEAKPEARPRGSEPVTTKATAAPTEQLKIVIVGHVDHGK